MPIKIGATLKDGRTLNAICTKHNMLYDSQYKYILKSPQEYVTITYNSITYKLTYLSGCFYPFLIRIS